MHVARWVTLRDDATAAVCGKSLTQIALAPFTTRNTRPRHGIKCVDRLLANACVEKDRLKGELFFATYKFQNK